jgi:hypothetical protein
VKTGDNVPIAGFIVSGATPKKVVVRAIGPSVPVNGHLEDPTLELYQQGNPVAIATNDDWKTTQQSEIEGTLLPPGDERESAIVRTLVPGSYTAVMRGKNNTTGVGLVEVYDVSGDASSVVANLSTRGFVETGDNVIIGGFIAGPADTAATSVIVRGIGPSLNAVVPSALEDPMIEVRDANAALLAANDDWQQSGDVAEIQAVGLAPGNAKESALLLPLVRPGGYTAILRGKSDGIGVGLVELYNLP